MSVLVTTDCSPQLYVLPPPLALRNNRTLIALWISTDASSNQSHLHKFHCEATRTMPSIVELLPQAGIHPERKKLH
jgi:hypothetical protein